MSWPLVKLAELCHVVTKGTTPTSIGYDFSNSGIPFLRIQNLYSSTVCLDDVLYINEETHAALGRSVIKPKDFLITIAGTIGRVAIVPDDFPESNCNQAIAIMRFDNNKLWPTYLLHWITTQDAMSQIAGKKVTATISNLSLGQIKELEIPLPPLPEQKRIAAILDKADAIRRKRQQAIKLADDFLRSVFLEMFGDPVSKGWDFVTIGEIASANKGSMRTGPFGSDLKHSEFTEEGVAVLGIDNAVKNKFSWDKERFISQKKYQELKRYTVRPGDVLITIMGTCGRCAVVPDDIPLAINTKHLCCITLDTRKCLPDFLHSYYLYHPIAAKYLNKMTKGAIMDGLNLGIIKEMPIPVVPINKQNDFYKIKMRVENLSKKMSEADKSLLFSSLQHRAFSDELAK